MLLYICYSLIINNDIRPGNRKYCVEFRNTNRSDLKWVIF